MNGKVSLTIPPAVAAAIKEGVSKESKLRVAQALTGLSACDLGVALIILSQDRDPDVKNAAIAGLRNMSEGIALQIAACPDTHPRILDILARLHHAKPVVAVALSAHENLPAETAAFLKTKNPAACTSVTPPVAPSPALPPEQEEPACDLPESEEMEKIEEAEDEAPPDEETEEFKSKYQLYQDMGVADKIKMALTGDKEWRTMLIKDSNKLVSGAVVKNPRITEGEVLAICKSVIQNDEILRVICLNKEWIKNYQIRKALALNTKTPLPTALRYVATLTEKDLAGMAKSKNISTAICSQARRILTAKSKH